MGAKDDSRRGSGQGGRPLEQDAVRTTIVGGRPPGSGKAVGAIPRGIEVLVKKAAVDDAFRKRLLEARAEAAADIDLELNPAEAAMLRAVPREQLERIIAQTEVPTESRAAFLGRAAAVMLAALGATGTACDLMPRGSAPDIPEKTPVPRPTPAETPTPASTPTPTPERTPAPTPRGIRPDRPLTKGIQPDRP